MFLLISGIILIILSIVLTIVFIIRTPDHLRGWYGKMYIALAMIGIIGGVIMLLVYFEIV